MGHELREMCHSSLVLELTLGSGTSNSYFFYFSLDLCDISIIYLYFVVGSFYVGNGGDNVVVSPPTLIFQWEFVLALVTWSLYCDVLVQNKRYSALPRPIAGQVNSTRLQLIILKIKNHPNLLSLLLFFCCITVYRS